MGTEGISLLIILANLYFTWKGLRDHAFFGRWAFHVDAILLRKEYLRLISSGFLHVSWGHFFFNMFSLYMCGEILEVYLGSSYFLLLYFASLLGGDLFALFMHRKHGDYTAVGASGAISGVIFASIALFPDSRFSLIFIPIGIPGWLLGIGFVLISIYGIRSKTDNIGHEAHLGGALAGMFTAILLKPYSLVQNWPVILLFTLPCAVFIYIILKHPAFLHIDNFFFRKSRVHSVDERYNTEKRSRELELDRLLEKIHRSGIDTLSTKERKRLDELSSR